MNNVTVSLRAEPGVSWSIAWRCPLCSGYWPLADLWGHLRDVHGWDRDVYEERRRGNVPRRKAG